MSMQRTVFPWSMTHLWLLLVLVGLLANAAGLRLHRLSSDQAILAAKPRARWQSLLTLASRSHSDTEHEVVRRKRRQSLQPSVGGGNDRSQTGLDRTPSAGKPQKFLQGTSTSEIASASQSEPAFHSSYKLSPSNLRILGGSARGRPIRSPDVFLRPMMAKVRGALFNTLQSLGILAPSSFPSSSVSSPVGTSSVVRVLDVFSGAGSVGLEALSRGAMHATFVDSSPECVQTCLENAESLGFADRTSSICARAEDVLAGKTGRRLDPYHLVALTPPYTQVNYTMLVQHLCTSALQSGESAGGLLSDNCIVVIEYPVEMGSLPFTLGPSTVLPSFLDGLPKRSNRRLVSPPPMATEDAVLFGLRNRRYGRTVLGIYVHKPTEQFDLRPAEFVPEAL